MTVMMKAFFPLQKLRGSQKFWLDTSLLLVEACLSKSDKRSSNPNKPDEEAIEKVLH